MLPSAGGQVTQASWYVLTRLAESWVNGSWVLLGLGLGEADNPQEPRLGVPSSPLCPCSYNNENFIYLADFPKDQSIKYLVNSFHGETAIVTETEEVGCPAPLPNPRVSLLPHQGKGFRGGKALRGPREGQRKLHF